MFSYAVACLNMDSLLPYAASLPLAYIIGCLFAYGLPCLNVNGLLPYAARLPLYAACLSTAYVISCLYIYSLPFSPLSLSLLHCIYFFLCRMIYLIAPSSFTFFLT
jgi:hypothetical protein